MEQEQNIEESLSKAMSKAVQMEQGENIDDFFTKEATEAVEKHLREGVDMITPDDVKREKRKSMAIGAGAGAGFMGLAGATGYVVTMKKRHNMLAELEDLAEEAFTTGDIVNAVNAIQEVISKQWLPKKEKKRWLSLLDNFNASLTVQIDAQAEARMQEKILDIREEK